MKRKYNIGDIVGDRKIINIFKNKGQKFYTLHCDKCKTDTDVPKFRIENKCGVCLGTRCIPYVNDLYTLRPDLLQYLKDVNDSIGVGIGSSKTIDTVCPICRTENAMRIYSLTNDGFMCKKCSVGKGSFGERLFSFILNKNNIDFEREKIFDWAKDFKYDFYISDLNCIIEIHGLQHYEECGMCKNNTLEERKEIDSIKLNLANKNKILKYIIIDSKESTFEYFIKSCSNNKDVMHYLKLNLDLDYSEFFEQDNGSVYFNIIELYINGFSKKYIAKMYNTSSQKVSSMLLTPYAVSKIEEKEKIENMPIEQFREKMQTKRMLNNLREKSKNKIICLETFKIYSLYKDASLDTKCSKVGISECCNGVNHFTRNKNGEIFHWMFLEEYNSSSKDKIENILKFKPNYKNGYDTGASEQTRRKFICCNTGKVYSRFDVASKDNNTYPRGISLCCNHKNIKTTRNKLTGEKLYWLFLDEYENMSEDEVLEYMNKKKGDKN